MSSRDPSHPKNVGHAVGSELSVACRSYLLGIYLLYLPRIILDDDMGISGVLYLTRNI